MDMEFEEIVDLSKYLKENIKVMSKTFNKDGYIIVEENNQFFFVKGEKKISFYTLIELMKID